MRISKGETTKSTKGYIMRKSVLFLGVVGVAVALSGVKVYASDAADIEGQGYNTPAVYNNSNLVGYDANNYPVITAILSAPGSVGGKNYTAWVFTAQDQSGSMVTYVAKSALAGLSTQYGPTDTTPTVGDGIAVSGAYQLYHSLPELEPYGSTNYVQLTSQGNSTASFAPTVLSINALNTAALASNVSGYYIELAGVTFSGGGTLSTVFPLETQGNGNYTLTDGTGSIADYDWVTSYSTAAALGGQAVPTGPVNVYGFVSVYPSTGLAGGGLPEFTVTSIVPEPSAFMLAGMGLLGLLAIRRRRS
jgi:hypothetical protein